MRTGSNSTALITGVAGQDGIYLTRHLLGLGYRVIETVRPDSRVSTTRAPYLEGIELRELGPGGARGGDERHVRAPDAGGAPRLW